MFEAEPHHIIAIGASAGGLVELNTFFKNTPLDGVSYVIVQHLSAEFKSHMVALLSKHSKLAVHLAEDGMPILGNQVYMIPNDKIMTVRGHTLYLSDKTDDRSSYLTINTFFASMAADYGPKAIAVVLSGLGSDGADGIKMIKKVGGLVIARQPDGTEFPSMPKNAIATGLVDFILEPEDMPAAIEAYVKHELDLLAASVHDGEHVDEIIALISRELPLDFSDYKHSTILRRIKRRAAFNNFSELRNYIEFIKATPTELEQLAKDFLIGVTGFFRDTESFEFIENQVIPAIVAELETLQEIRIWVAGCATGEEAYSLAILFCEQLGDNLGEHVVKIFATDIDNVALLHAGKGVYNPGMLANVSPERLKKFFRLEGEDYCVSPALRKMIIFAQHDLVKNPPFRNMHFISCRNVLIYMTPTLQKKIYLMLLFGLKQNGYLFLGSSENPLPILQSLKVISKKAKIYKNIEINPLVKFGTFSLPEVSYKQWDIPLLQEQGYKIPDRTLGDAVNETLMKELDQFLVVIDQNEKILKFYGDPARFLLPKLITAEFPELLPIPLAVAFKTVVRNVLDTGKTFSVNGINIKQGDRISNVSLSVSPMVHKGRRNGFLIARLSEDSTSELAINAGETYDEEIYLDQYTKNLEQEVKDLKEKLLASNEQVGSMGEYMQSFNEELLSANLEMQSTSEEMQSINEELHTINADYQLKNKELLDLNDDLNNYFRSNVNGQLFVDDQHRLAKFTPATTKLINVIESDLGRPLSDISTNFKLESISEDISQVLAREVVITKEIQTKEGKWYQVITMPYIRQIDNKTSGAVVTFNDITEFKAIQRELAKRTEP